MKSFIKIFTLLVVFAVSVNLNAQKALKFGYIESQALLQAMPERAKAQDELKKLAETLQEQAETMQVEFNNKYEAYINQRDSLKPLIRQTKETEIQELQNRIQQFQSNAQQELQTKEKELLEPIMEKAEKAIKDVGTENGFSAIFPKEAVLFQSADLIDVLPMVKKKLGITQ